MLQRHLVSTTLIALIAFQLTSSKATANPDELERLTELTGAEFRIEDSKLTIGKIRKFSWPAQKHWMTGTKIVGVKLFDEQERVWKEAQGSAQEIASTIMREVFERTPSGRIALQMEPACSGVSQCHVMGDPEHYKTHVKSEFVELNSISDYERIYGPPTKGELNGAYCNTYLPVITGAEFSGSGTSRTIVKLAPTSPLAAAGFKVGDVITSFASPCGSTGEIDKSIADNRILEVMLDKGLDSRGYRKSVGIPVAFKAASDAVAVQEKPIIPIGEAGFAEYRWTLLEEGNLKQLDRVWEYDVSEIMKLQHPVTFKLFPNFRQELSSARYAGLFAQYALMKGAMLGLCGNPGTSYAHTTEVYKQVKNGFGAILREELSSRDVDKFEVEAKFSEWVDLHGSNKVWYPYLQSIKALLQGEKCGSPRLAKIEDNMILFYSKTF